MILHESEDDASEDRDVTMQDDNEDNEDNNDDDNEEPEEEEVADIVIPRSVHPRRRGRPPGRARAPTRHMVRISKDGKEGEVVNDEVDLPEDPDGEMKVDKNGNLQGGRDYRVRVFKIPTRGDRLYMLSTEPARCTGFRDSYLFFNKHMQLHKVVLEENEKYALIDAEVIPHSYKGRTIGVVTARSVFREFGARIIVGGKRIVDDYYVQIGKARGDVEGELADPYDALPPPGEPYNKNQYVAWHGASAVYHTSGPNVAQPNAAKKKTPITSANWALEHARGASNYNSTLAQRHRDAFLGLFDPHTNLYLVPNPSTSLEGDRKIGSTAA